MAAPFSVDRLYSLFTQMSRACKLTMVDCYLLLGGSLVEALLFLRIIPVDVRVPDDEDLRGSVKRGLLGMVARVGDVLEVSFLGHPFGFRVLEARPEGGRIGENTEFLFTGLEPANERAQHLRDMHLYWSKRPLTRSYLFEYARAIRDGKVVIWNLFDGQYV